MKNESSTMKNPVVHFDIGCRDREKASQFYSDLFGWSMTDYGPLSRKVDTGCDTGINGHITALGHEPHQYVMLYVEVDDIAAYTSKATELGGEVVIPETQIPGGGNFAWIKDVDGNMVGLHKSA